MKSKHEYKDSTFTCSCGAEYQTRSTSREAKNSVDVCSSCHPAYTGKTRIKENTSQVNKYYEKYQRNG